MNYVSCPHCAASLEDDRTQLGEVACPFCGGQFTLRPPLYVRGRSRKSSPWPLLFKLAMLATAILWAGFLASRAIAFKEISPGGSIFSPLAGAMYVGVSAPFAAILVILGVAHWISVDR